MPDSGEGKFWRRFWRLNPNVSQREADFQAGRAMASLLDEAGRNEIAALAAQKEHIRAIKRIRELTGLRLLDSKRIYESVWR